MFEMNLFQDEDEDQDQLHVYLNSFLGQVILTKQV